MGLDAAPVGARLARLPWCTALAIGIVALSGCATAVPSERPLPERSTINLSTPIGPFCGATVVGDMLFASGQVGTRPGTKELVPGGIEAETRQALENLAAVLGSAGFSMADVVRCEIYLQDLGDYQAMNHVYQEFFADGDYPARATVQVARLVLAARIEISCIAVKGRKSNR
ncbi:MAG: Rid family detoxifying hydrolase [Planctomycetota bacterium]